MTFNAVTFRCFEKITIKKCFCTCLRSKDNFFKDRFIFYKIPEGVDYKVLFNQSIKDNSFNMVVNADMLVISVETTDEISKLFGIDLRIMKGKKIQELKKLDVPESIIVIFEDMIKSVIQNNFTNGFIFGKNEGQPNAEKYIICSYPIVGAEMVYGVYINKQVYYEGSYNSNFFK